MNRRMTALLLCKFKQREPIKQEIKPQYKLRDKNCKLTKFSSSTAPTSNDSLRSPGLSGLVLYEKVIKSTVLWYYGGGGAPYNEL